jgi:anti-anti-sigma factor
MSLTASLDRVGSAVVVAVAGELDLATAPILQERISAAEALAPPLLVLDLRELTFLDSTGLRIVLAADAAARRDARRLVVVRGSDPVHRVFLIALLDKRLELVDDLEAALGGSTS